MQNLLTGKGDWLGKLVLYVLSAARISTHVCFVFSVKMTQAHYNYLVQQVEK